MLNEVLILDLIPNNFYINEDKLSKIREVYKNKKEGDLPPVTVAIINNEYSLIDGHSRTMAAFENNNKTILANVVSIEDIEGPTKLYLKIHEEAKYKGIISIEKLRDKIVENKDHKKLWVDYCTKLMKNL